MRFAFLREVRLPEIKQSLRVRFFKPPKGGNSVEFGNCENKAFLRLSPLLWWDSGGRFSGVRRRAGRCKSSSTELKRGTVDNFHKISSQKSMEISSFRGVWKTPRF